MQAMHLMLAIVCVTTVLVNSDSQKLNLQSNYVYKGRFDFKPGPNSREFQALKKTKEQSLFQKWVNKRKKSLSKLKNMVGIPSKGLQSFLSPFGSKVANRKRTRDLQTKKVPHSVESIREYLKYLSNHPGEVENVVMKTTVKPTLQTYIDKIRDTFSFNPSPALITEDNSEIKPTEKPSLQSYIGKIRDSFFSSNESPPSITKDKYNLIQGPSLSTEDKFNFIQGPPLSTEDKFNYIQGPPLLTKDKFNYVQGPPLSTEDKFNYIQGPPLSTEDKFNYIQGPPLSTEDKFNYMQGPPLTTEDEFHFNQGRPLSTEDKFNFIQSPPSTIENQFRFIQSPPSPIENTFSFIQNPPSTIDDKFNYFVQSPPSTTEDKFNFIQNPPSTTEDKFNFIQNLPSTPELFKFQEIRDGRPTISAEKTEFELPINLKTTFRVFNEPDAEQNETLVNSADQFHAQVSHLDNNYNHQTSDQFYRGGNIFQHQSHFEPYDEQQLQAGVQVQEESQNNILLEELLFPPTTRHPQFKPNFSPPSSEIPNFSGFINVKESTILKQKDRNFPKLMSQGKRSPEMRQIPDHSDSIPFFKFPERDKVTEEIRMTNRRPKSGPKTLLVFANTLNSDNNVQNLVQATDVFQNAHTFKRQFNSHMNTNREHQEGVLLRDRQKDKNIFDPGEFKLIFNKDETQSQFPSELHTNSQTDIRANYGITDQEPSDYDSLQKGILVSSSLVATSITKAPKSAIQSVSFRPIFPKKNDKLTRLQTNFNQLNNDPRMGSKSELSKLKNIQNNLPELVIRPMAEEGYLDRPASAKTLFKSSFFPPHKIDFMRPPFPTRKSQMWKLKNKLHPEFSDLGQSYFELQNQVNANTGDDEVVEVLPPTILFFDKAKPNPVINKFMKSKFHPPSNTDTSSYTNWKKENPPLRPVFVPKKHKPEKLKTSLKFIGTQLPPQLRSSPFNSIPVPSTPPKIKDKKPFSPSPQIFGDTLRFANDNPFIPRPFIESQNLLSMPDSQRNPTATPQPQKIRDGLITRRPQNFPSPIVTTFKPRIQNFNGKIVTAKPQSFRDQVLIPHNFGEQVTTTKPHSLPIKLHNILGFSTPRPRRGSSTPRPRQFQSVLQNQSPHTQRPRQFQSLLQNQAPHTQRPRQFQSLLQMQTPHTQRPRQFQSLLQTQTPHTPKPQQFHSLLQTQDPHTPISSIKVIPRPNFPISTGFPAPPIPPSFPPPPIYPLPPKLGPPNLRRPQPIIMNRVPKTKSVSPSNTLRKSPMVIFSPPQPVFPPPPSFMKNSLQQTSKPKKFRNSIKLPSFSDSFSSVGKPVTEQKVQGNNEELPKKYEYRYVVKDPATNLQYGHAESRLGKKVRGEYFVTLPDGRTQHVIYVSDEKGYKTDVKYYSNSMPLI